MSGTWRAVDQRGITLGVLVTRRRDAAAAGRFLRKLLNNEQYVPRVLVTDKLRPYGAAKRHVLRGVEHRQSKYLNNRAENSHQRTRLREHAMRRSSSPGQAGRFWSAHDPIYGHFRPPRHDMDAETNRATLTDRHRSWDDVTATLLDQSAACQQRLGPIDRAQPVSTRSPRAQLDDAPEPWGGGRGMDADDEIVWEDVWPHR